MTDDRSQRARAAAEAGTATREQLSAEAWNNVKYGINLAAKGLPESSDELTAEEVEGLEVVLRLALEWLSKTKSKLPQRDGYATAQSIGPDVGERRYG